MKPDKKPQPMTLPVIKQLYELGKLDLVPDFQRESVWTLSQRQLLMDSLLRGFDVPKLYFSAVGNDRYEVVDGQQRIRSIIDFYNNKFALSDEAEPLDVIQVKNLRFNQLPSEALLALNMAQLDIVILLNYSDEEVREMFERLQNGTSLNAAEKRHAIISGMTDVVRALAQHKVFTEVCAFTGARYAFEDLAAKTLHEFLANTIVDIRPTSIKRTYAAYSSMAEGDAAAKKAKRVYNFIRLALKDRTVRLKKYALLSLAILVGDLMEGYNLSKFGSEFGHWYEDFERRRIENNQLDEGDDNWNAELSEFTENARNDSVAALTYRDKVLRQEVFKTLQDLERLDRTRLFDPEQRFIIYLRGGKRCAECDKQLETIDEMHADHIVPYSNGGHTRVSNGRSLCSECNLLKGDKAP